jgi:hypothetical protein
MTLGNFRLAPGAAIVGILAAVLPFGRLPRDLAASQ